MRHAGRKRSEIATKVNVIYLCNLWSISPVNSLRFWVFFKSVTEMKQTPNPRQFTSGTGLSYLKFRGLFHFWLAFVKVPKNSRRLWLYPKLWTLPLTVDWKNNWISTQIFIKSKSNNKHHNAMHRPANNAELIKFLEQFVFYWNRSNKTIQTNTELLHRNLETTCVQLGLDLSTRYPSLIHIEPIAVFQ